MAQKKYQKQAKALRYWIDRWGSRYIRKFERDSLPFIKSQIQTLTGKLKIDPHYSTAHCVMCRLEFVVLEPVQVLCPFCRYAFIDVELSIRTIGESFVNMTNIVETTTKAFEHFAHMTDQFNPDESYKE